MLKNSVHLFTESTDMTRGETIVSANDCLGLMTVKHCGTVNTEQIIHECSICFFFSPSFCFFSLLFVSFERCKCKGNAEVCNDKRRQQKCKLQLSRVGVT